MGRYIRKPPKRDNRRMLICGKDFLDMLKSLSPDMIPQDTKDSKEYLAQFLPDKIRIELDTKRLSTMLGKPKFKEGDKVIFASLEETKEGTIFIVDPWGTFEDTSDVSYDILVDDENCLYKHIREKDVIGVDQN